MKLKIFILSIIVIIFIFLINIFSEEQDLIKANAKKYKFALVTGINGLGDKGFNDMQYKGMMLAKKKFGINFDYFSPKSVNDFTGVMENFIKKVIM